MFPVLCVDDAPRERGRPARTMPRHSLGHLRHSDRPGTAPGVSLGLAVEVHTDRLAGCQVALTLSDLHKGIRMRAGRPRSQEMRITPPLRGSRRSRAARRRLMRWGGGSPGRQAGVPVSRRAAAAQNRVRRPGTSQWICFTIPPEGAMVAPRIRFAPVPIHVLYPHALKTGPTRH